MFYNFINAICVLISNFGAWLGICAIWFLMFCLMFDSVNNYPYIIILLAGCYLASYLALNIDEEEES